MFIRVCGVFLMGKWPHVFRTGLMSLELETCLLDRSHIFHTGVIFGIGKVIVLDSSLRVRDVDYCCPLLYFLQGPPSDTWPMR